VYVGLGTTGAGCGLGANIGVGTVLGGCGLGAVVVVVLGVPKRPPNPAALAVPKTTKHKIKDIFFIPISLTL
jgi:uncharacterized membrane protein YczE